ncbi:MAG: hypothetical protein RL685_2332 [Pseudomonadota bacterium]
MRWVSSGALRLWACTWAAFLALELALFADLFTRVHPTWQVTAADFIPATLRAAGLLCAFNGLVTFPACWPRWPLVWALLQCVVRPFLFLQLSWDWVYAASGAARWWSQASGAGMLSYGRQSAYGLGYLASFLRGALSHLPLQYVYRSYLLLLSPGAAERLLLAFGIGLGTLSFVTVKELMFVPEQYDARPQLAEATRLAIAGLRENAWLAARGLSLVLVVVATGLMVRRGRGRAQPQLAAAWQE